MVVMTNTSREDVLELLDYAWVRLADRMDGLTDAEWSWRPSATDPEISIRWRLEHVATMLSEPRNARWLGSDSTFSIDVSTASSAVSAQEMLSNAYTWFRDVAGDRALDLDQEIGQIAGRLGSATRRSFVLHVADELIHHGAEASLLRDLYLSRQSR